MGKPATIFFAAVGFVIAVSVWVGYRTGWQPFATHPVFRGHADTWTLVELGPFDVAPGWELRWKVRGQVAAAQVLEHDKPEGREQTFCHDNVALAYFSQATGAGPLDLIGVEHFVPPEAVHSIPWGGKVRVNFWCIGSWKVEAVPVGTRVN